MVVSDKEAGSDDAVGYKIEYDTDLLFIFI